VVQATFRFDTVKRRLTGVSVDGLTAQGFSGPGIAVAAADAVDDVELAGGGDVRGAIDPGDGAAQPWRAVVL
jgi:hypothetical protein